MVCILCAPFPGSSLLGKSHRSDPVSTRYRCLDFLSIKKSWPEMVVQTLAAIKLCRWFFPFGDGLSFGGSLFDSGSPSDADSTVVWIFGLRPRSASDTNKFRGATEYFRWCCRGNLWSASVGGLWLAGDCVWDAWSEATWRESSSIPSRSPIVLSVLQGVMLTVVGMGVNLEICQRCGRLSRHCPPSGQQDWLARALVDGWPRWCEENFPGRL